MPMDVLYRDKLTYLSCGSLSRIKLRNMIQYSGNTTRIFQKTHAMVNTIKSQRRTFYTIISIAKSTLYSLYYKHSGRITESRVCKIFSSHLAIVRKILPTSLRDGFKHIQDIEFNPTTLKTIKKKFRTQEKLNTARIKKKTHNILCLESYKN